MIILAVGPNRRGICFPKVKMIRSQLQYNTELKISTSTDNLVRANKIICTIGPVTQSVEKLKELIDAGMAIARMNFSHGSHAYHKDTIDNVRQAAKECNRYVAIALDTKGPEIRTGLFVAAETPIESGSTVIVTCDPQYKEQGTAERFYVDYENICNIVAVGGHVFIDDGVLDLEVVERLSDTDLKCVANNAHVLSNRKGVNLPRAPVDLPAVSDKDREDLKFGSEQGVDFVFASFIRSASQVNEVREALGPKGKNIQIISKIENWQGVDDIDAIIAASNGIMVARGDLGVEIPAEKVVVAQKLMISKCNAAGKPVICATQMLESMTYNPRPTRAEVSDVANAVLDGADAVMLSGETAKGKYPKEVVQYMSRICLEAQNATWNMAMFENIKNIQPVPMSPEESICASAVNSVHELQAKAIIVLTNTGRSGRLVAKYRPTVPIMCVSQQPEPLRALAVVRGTVPVFYNTDLLGEDPDKEKRVSLAIKVAKRLGVVSPGDLVITVHADLQTKGFANQTRAIYVQ